MKMAHPNLTACLLGFLIPLLIYSGIAFPMFQWRNPKANEMAFYTEFGSVITFQQMEKYQ